MIKKRDSKKLAFIDIFIKTHDFEFAIKKAGISKLQGQQYLNKYKNIYTAIFEKMGLPKEEVVKHHALLITDPVASETKDMNSGTVIKKFDKGVQAKAIEMYYKLTNAIEDSKVVINNVAVSDTDKIKELEIARKISEDPVLREQFMNVIEKRTMEDGK